MANRKHIQPLIAAIESMSMEPWNRWRIENPSIRPDLSGVELPEANLSFANLSYADISHADLSRANLHHANLRHADLSSTNLRKAELTEADLSFSILQGTDLRGAILGNAKLRGTHLIGALIDQNATEGQEKRVRGGVSKLEKLALRLFARKKRKDHRQVNGDTKTHRSDKHT